MRVLVACEFSGVVRNAFSARGHDAVSCDLLPTESPGEHYQGDVLEILDAGWDLIIAHPPCTYLAISGARWWQNRQAEQKEAIEFFKKMLFAPCKKVCVENPVGIISTVLQKPTQYVQPWEFGHGETKKTGLWLRNLPKLEPTNVVPGREQRILKESPGPDRWKRRSKTYTGIAEAMATQWGLCDE